MKKRSAKTIWRKRNISRSIKSGAQTRWQGSLKARAWAKNRKFKRKHF